MKIEDQVCTFEQAKKLVEIGVILDTAFVWFINRNRCWKLELRNYFNDAYIKDISIPVPTVAELGILLSGYQIILTPDDGWQVFNPDGIHHGFLAQYCDILPEAQARAAALIWLIENGDVDPKTLKL